MPWLKIAITQDSTPHGEVSTFYPLPQEITNPVRVRVLKHRSQESANDTLNKEKECTRSVEEEWENGIAVRSYLSPLNGALRYVVELDDGLICTVAHGEVERTDRNWIVGAHIEDNSNNDGLDELEERQQSSLVFSDARNGDDAELDALIIAEETTPNNVNFNFGDSEVQSSTVDTSTYANDSKYYDSEEADVFGESSTILGAGECETNNKNMCKEDDRG